MGSNPVIWALIFGVAVSGLIIVLSLLFGLCVSIAGRSYSEKLQRQYQNRLRQLLPGKDCGQCGCESCDVYARMVLFGVEGENACPHADADTPQKMLALVKEMQQLMEDPKPIKKRKKRSFLFWKANQ